VVVYGSDDNIYNFFMVLSPALYRIC